MAKLKSADMEIGKRSGCEGIGRLAPPPTQPAQSSISGAPLPPSSEGQAIFSAVAETLLDTEGDNGLSI